MLRYRRVSATTAVAALRVLEQCGLISARDVSTVSLAEVLDASNAALGIVPLGSAIPEPDWFPLRNLQRRVTALLRREPSLVAEYGPVEGLPALRHQIARYFPTGTRISRPADGFVLWVELPGRVDADMLQARARRENISVIAGSVFSACGG